MFRTLKSGVNISRRGSVLILVVVLVVLLALMGTALLSTTRNDTYVAAQNSANTEVDMLLEGVKQMAIATVTDPTNRFDSVNWNWDMPWVGDGIPQTSQSDQHDLWLSPRLPEGMEDFSGARVAAIVWPTVGILPVTLPAMPHFDSPTGGTFTIRGDTTSANTNAHNRLEFVSTGSSPTWHETTTALGSTTFGAADTDADGIPDSGFFKLPVGELDGVTYYAAMRIIDNNSAVNVNTAYSSRADWDFSSPIQPCDAFGGQLSAAGNNLGMFRSHIDLFEMLHDPTNEMAAINTYRFNGATPTATAYDKTGQPINGVTFITQGDMIDHQIADQILSPGYVSNAKPFQPFSTSDAQALAYHFTLANLNASKSPLESALAGSGAATLDSVYQSAMNVASWSSSSLSVAKGRSAYPPNMYQPWFDENFNYAALQGNGLPPLGVRLNRSTTISRPIRAILTTYNPVSNQVLPRTMPDGTQALPPDPAMAPYRTPTTTPPGAPVKTNVNTAKFGELYRAYWSVMADNFTTTGTPFTVAQTPDPTYGAFLGMQFNPSTFASDIDPAHFNPQYMFRSTVRDPRTTTPFMLKNSDQLLIRAASAAVNTMYLRDSSNSLPQPINLPASGVAANVFPIQPQPFIAEVFVYYERAPQNQPNPPNRAPYVAIKLYNPFSVAVTLGSNSGICTMYRTTNPPKTYTTPFAANGTLSQIASLGITIQPNDFFLIDNFGPQVTERPTAAGDLSAVTSDSAHYLAVPGLENTLNREMMIITNRASSLPLGSPPGIQVLDSFDFTGFDWQGSITQTSPVAGAAWHYARAHGPGATRWLCVYPGRYDASINVSSGAGLTAPRHQGTETDTWTTTPDGSDWKSGSWKLPNGQASGPTLGVNSRATGTFPQIFPIQLAFDQLYSQPGAQAGAGPNAGQGKYPFGGFARNGDILQVPFIAACTITSGANLVELTSVSMDAAFAEDSDVNDDPNPNTAPAAPAEQIGRFCPISVYTTPNDLNSTPLVADFYVDPTTGLSDPTAGLYRYAWARRLFDYLTVQSPGTDYMPNDPVMIGQGQAQPVDNDGDKTAGLEDGPTAPTAPTGYTYTVGAEDAVGVQGLININTAPWKVLAAIPWVPKGQHNYLCEGFNFSGPNGDHPTLDDNAEIAMAIVKWRDGDPSSLKLGKPHGPFKSIFDLMAIQFPDPSDPVMPNKLKFLFQRVQQDLMLAGEPGVAQGDFSGTGNGGAYDGSQPDQTRNDFEEQYLLLTKVSNLLTTRSDTFTVYIDLQGWRGIGGTKPSKVVERRAALIIDRTPATKDNPSKIRRWDLSND